MKLETHDSWIARNLKLGAIYVHKHSLEAARLIAIFPCQGVWIEYADGSGYGETIPFEEVLYATKDEVQDFLEDLEVFNNDTFIKE